MCKMNFSFWGLCLLFVANLIRAIAHGFDWVFVVAAIVTAAAVVLNIVEAKHGREQAQA